MTCSVHRLTEAKDMLALGSLLFLVDVFPWDSLLLLSRPSLNKVQRRLRVTPVPLLEECILKLLFWQLCFCQDEAQIEMHNTT